MSLLKSIQKWWWRRSAEIVATDEFTTTWTDHPGYDVMHAIAFYVLPNGQRFSVVTSVGLSAPLARQYHAHLRRTEIAWEIHARLPATAVRVRQMASQSEAAAMLDTVLKGRAP